MNTPDRIKETTTTTGTGTITLGGAPTGFKTFSSRFATGDEVYYTIVLGSEWEVGIGTLASSSTISRDQVLASSNSDALVDFSAGTKDVFVTLPGFLATRIMTRGQIFAHHLALI